MLDLVDHEFIDVDLDFKLLSSKNVLLSLLNSSQLNDLICQNICSFKHSSSKLEIDEQRLTNIDESFDKVVDCLIRETYSHRIAWRDDCKSVYVRQSEICFEFDEARFENWLWSNFNSSSNFDRSCSFLAFDFATFSSLFILFFALLSTFFHTLFHFKRLQIIYFDQWIRDWNDIWLERSVFFKEITFRNVSKQLFFEASTKRINKRRSIASIDWNVCNSFNYVLLFYFEMSFLSYIALLVARMIRTFDIVAFVISNNLSLSVTQFR